MKRLLPTFLALVLSAIAMPRLALAQFPSGPYVGIGAGVSWLLEGNQAIHPMPNSGLSTPSDHFRMGWEPGFIGTVSLGWAFSFGMRVELEGQYRQNDADPGRSLVFSRRGGGGSVDSQAITANIFWDMSLRWLGATDEYVVPYIGAGMGYRWRQFNNVGGEVDGNRIIFNDNGEGALYQLMAGLGFPLAWAGLPGFVASFEYRLIMGDTPILNATVTGPGGTRRPVEVDAATDNHNLLFRLRYTFSRPRTLQAEVPSFATATVRTFLVFFDWNRADLTARARQIIGEAAQARTRQALTRIEVSGHTDTSGSARYNQGLSERRAAAIAAELVRLGVPRNEIVTRGFGQTRLLVATPDNTREPQNRRVEIILR